jgi:AraC-like DNA-binding protein
MAKYKPAPPLSRFVDFLWESGPYAPPHKGERVLPTGAMDLVIDVSTDGGECSTVSAPHSTFHLLDTSRPRQFVGARFTLGGGLAFFGPAHALRDLDLPLATIWGEAARELRERLAVTPPGAARFAVLEQFLLLRLDRNVRRHPAVRHALLRLQRSDGSGSIGALVEECGLSHRRFIELFSNEVGLTPKQYGRLCRFRRSLSVIGIDDEVNWADLAADCGYSDQSRLIHEFRAFAGFTPTLYLEHRTANLNHLRNPS